MSNNGIVNIHGKDYMTVAKRVELWHEEVKANNDELGIETEVLSHTPLISVKATVYWNKKKFTGISAVDPSSSKLIEKQNPYEVAETSAVGRALGFAGYGIIEGIASADEMEKGGNNVDAEEEPPMPTEEKLPDDKKVCSAHGSPVVMYKGQSKSKVDENGNPKTYWWHKGPEGKMCFGDGYKD